MTELITLDDLLDGPVSCQALARMAMMMYCLYQSSDVVVRQITFGRETLNAWCKLLNEQADWNRDNHDADGKRIYVKSAFLRPEGMCPLVGVTDDAAALAESLRIAANLKL